MSIGAFGDSSDDCPKCYADMCIEDAYYKKRLLESDSLKYYHLYPEEFIDYILNSLKSMRLRIEYLEGVTNYLDKDRDND